MVILIDTNVVLNYLLQREPGYLQAKQIIQKCAEEKITAYIAFHSISIIWYVLRRIPDEQRRNILKELLEIVYITGASHNAVKKALEKRSFKDFEDCLQDMCAANVDAEYIVTDNIKDFSNSVTKTITSKDFCENVI